MNRKTFQRIVCLLIIFIFTLSGCSETVTNKQGKMTTAREATFDFESLKVDWNDFKQLHVIVPSRGAVPENFKAHSDTIKEVNNILLSKINTEINIEHIIYNKQPQEIYERIYSGDNVDIIDYIPPNGELQEHLEDLNVADLTDKLHRYYPEIYEDNVDFSDILINDRIYAMPKINVKAYQDRVCLIINRKLYEKAGSPKVETVNDIVKLYEFGLTHDDDKGRKFLDPTRKRYFVFEFHTLLQLYCQENGYQLSNRLFVFKDGEIMLIEDTNLLREWFDIVENMCEGKAILQMSLSSHVYDYNNDMGMGLTYYGNLKNMNWPEHFKQKYQVLFINDYEPYSQKRISPMALILNNENTDRSIMALRLLYEDRQLNHLIQYGIEGTHYTINNGRVEMIPDSRYLYTRNWWPSLVNGRHSYSMVYEPEGAEQYVADLYQRPKNIIPGVSNFFFSGAIEVINADPKTKEAFQQRENFILNQMWFYKDTISEGLPYDILIQDNLDQEKQKTLLETLREYITLCRKE